MPQDERMEKRRHSDRLLAKALRFLPATIDHFTIVCFVAWPLNEGEAGGDLALIETFLLFLC